MTLLNRLAEAQRLWNFALPNTPEPPNQTWVRWLSKFTDEEIEKAITRLVSRYQTQALPEGDALYRVMTSNLVHLRDQRGARAVTTQEARP